MDISVLGDSYNAVISCIKRMKFHKHPDSYADSVVHALKGSSFTVNEVVNAMKLVSDMSGRDFSEQVQEFIELKAKPKPKKRFMKKPKTEKSKIQKLIEKSDKSIEVINDPHVDHVNLTEEFIDIIEHFEINPVEWDETFLDDLTH